MVGNAMIRTINTSAHDMRGVADGSVQAVITSPPYYGLRSYAGDQDVEWPTVTYRLNEWCEPVTVQGCEPGCKHEWVDTLRPAQSGGTASAKVHIKGQDNFQIVPETKQAYCLHCGGWRGPLGLEPSPVAYIGHLILCLREWRRVLRDDGVCFVNLGDSYNSAASNMQNGVVQRNGYNAGYDAIGRKTVPATGLKPKDLLGIPWMFAFAARADGWWLRSDIVWAKPNPMPESVTDRPTKAHEMIFLLAKSQRYFWDADAVREESVDPEGSAKRYEAPFFVGDKHESGGYSANGAKHTAGIKEFNGTRNIRTVWTVSTQPYPGAHYAVWPSKLVEPMIKAATSERGCCPNCGAAWRRVVERSGGERYATGKSAAKNSNGLVTAFSGYTDGSSAPTFTTIGWQPACTCDAGDPVPCTVLDPFAGSGTTGRVAASLGRAAILCDVSAEYLIQHVPERTTVQIGLPQL